MGLDGEELWRSEYIAHNSQGNNKKMKKIKGSIVF